MLDSYQMTSSISDQTITLTPKKAKEGAWAKVKITYTDEYDRTFE